MAWALAAVLAVVLLIGIGFLEVRLRPYWVAKYRGERAELQGVVLVFGPFQVVALIATKLQGAKTGGSKLETAARPGAYLGSTTNGQVSTCC